jgi:hypothetical protein
MLPLISAGTRPRHAGFSILQGTSLTPQIATSKGMRESALHGATN